MDGYYWIVIYDQLQIAKRQGGFWWAVGWEHPLCPSDISFIVERIYEPGGQKTEKKQSWYMTDTTPRFCC